MLGVGEGLAPRQFGDVGANPRALAFYLLRVILTVVALHMKAHDAGETCPGPSQTRRQVVYGAIKLVADDQPLLIIKHRQPSPHVVECDVEPTIELLQLLLALQKLRRVFFQGC